MNRSVAFQLVRNRTLFVALANAGATYTILYIAPLGMMAVYACTGCVFIASLLLGSLCDRAYRLLSPEERAFLAGEGVEDSSRPHREAQVERPGLPGR